MTQQIRNLIYRVTARTESRMAVLIETDAEGNAESEMINFSLLRATIVGAFLIDYSRRTRAATSFLTHWFYALFYIHIHYFINNFIICCRQWNETGTKVNKLR